MLPTSFKWITVGFMVAFAAVTLAGEKGIRSKRIEEVLKDRTDPLMSLRGVVGTAQGLCEGKPCVKIFVIKKTPELERRIRNLLEGYPAVIEEPGETRALPEEQDPRS